MSGKGSENHWEGFENKRAPNPNSSQCERDGGKIKWTKDGQKYRTRVTPFPTSDNRETFLSSRIT